jgi:hypothetical protein
LKLLLKTSKLLNQFQKKINGPKILLLGPFLFLSLNSYSQFNKPTTAFSWVVDNENPYKGQCYEYDIETGGNQFQVKVSKRKCHPKKTIFHWVADKSGIGGKCYEVDEESKGQKYSSNSLAKNCHQENQSYQFVQTEQLKGECYQIISDSNRRKVRTKFCRPSDVSYNWLPNQNGWGGRCYMIDSESGPSSYIEKANALDCKPSEVVFELKVNSINPGGECYEVDAESGRMGYSNKTKRENCFEKKSKIEYHWQQTEALSGKCIEVQQSSSGTPTYKSSGYKKCIDFETSFRFQRLTPVSGVCTIIDKETQGENFINKVGSSNCRNSAGALEFQFITYPEGKEFCYELDTKTSGQNFIKKVNSDKCNDFKIYPKWFSSDESPWKGKCLKTLKSGEIKSKKSLMPIKCRPKEVKVLWYNFSKFNGDCFEVDAKKGPEYFVRKVDIKKCRPKYTKYVFYREKGAQSGTCYSVDSKTGGDKYFKKVGSKLCKRELKQIEN